MNDHVVLTVSNTDRPMAFYGALEIGAAEIHAPGAAASRRSALLRRSDQGHGWLHPGIRLQKLAARRLMR